MLQRTSPARRFPRGFLLIVVLTMTPWPAAGETIKGTAALVDADGRPVKKPDRSGVVVWLEPAASVTSPAASPAKPITVSQRKLMFVPHVTAIQVGTAVDFPNDDPIFHNVFSNFDGQVFDLQLYAPQTARRVVFRRPGIVRVFCNIHDSMSAFIAVMPQPYFAVSDTQGRFEIQAPPGEYRVQFWYERARPDTLARLARSVTIGNAPLSLPETQIPVSNDPPPPHKDKYGRDYAQKGEDRIFYQGARR